MMIRRLRGLRAQLLLWTILPLAVVLVVLSLAGITRHRQAMTQLVEDRDRGLALAEANRLGREVDQRIVLLVRAAGDPGLQGDLADASPAAVALTESLRDGYGGGLALLDATGTVLWGTSEGREWATGSSATALAAGVAATGQPQTAEYTTAAGAPGLFIGAPALGGRVLVGALPVETLSLAESSLLAQTVTHGAVFVLNRAGRLVHHNNPAGLAVDPAALAHLPPPVEGAGLTYLNRRGAPQLLVAYAPVEPPGWTLAIVEDVEHVSSMGMSVVEVLPMLLLFIAVVGLLAVSFGVANIVRPLQELDRRAARVAWGEFDAVDRPVGGVQEVDDLRITLAQMAARIRTYQTGMRDYLSAVTQAQEEERARLAHELHDDTVQALIALKQRAQMARKALGHAPDRAASRLDELEKLIDQELAALRRLIGDLRPIYLEDLGFVPTLEMLVKQIEQRHRLAGRLEVRGEPVRLAPDLELAAFRIVQQALTNVAAHAHAQNVSVGVAFAADGLTLTVQDDGQGFIPPEQPADLARTGHFGLMGMRERAMLYGGHLMIASAPGKGATISAWLPIN